MAMGGAERMQRHANAQAHHARLQKIVLTWDYFDLVKHSKVLTSHFTTHAMMFLTKINVFEQNFCRQDIYNRVRILPKRV